MLKCFLFLFSLIISINGLASWQNNFYTDDSDYYHQVTSNGFTHYIRVKNSDCRKIKNIWVEFKSKNKTNFQKTSRYPHTLYGINPNNYCWYKAEVNGLDLNQPQNNQYVFSIQDQNNKIYYFGEIKSSILPQNRLETSLDKCAWMNPGTQGANIVKGGGILFKVWAPLADEVEIFIGKGSNKFTMFPDSNKKNPIRNHVRYINSANKYTTYHYQFITDGKYETVEIDRNHNRTAIKMDPMAREIIYDKKSASLNNYKNVYSLVSSRPDHDWEFDHLIKSYVSLSRNNNWIIYQLWPMAFNPKQTIRGHVPGTFKNILEKVDYLSNLGINAVELLPVHEFRFNASWGYLLDSIKLIEKSYGSPLDLIKLSDKLHQRGIKLILDVVINHINNTLIRDPLSPGNISSKYYDAETGWGPRPRMGSPMVAKWISDSLIGLVRDYHLDGFRFDMIKFIYINNPAGYKFLQELTQILKIIHPDIHLMAEELPDNVWTTFPISNNGLGFDSQWSDIFKNFFEYDLDDYSENHRSFNPEKLIGALHGYSNHGNYRFGSPKKTVNFIGSHDFIGNRDPIIRIVSDYFFEERAGNKKFLRVKPLSDSTNLPYRFRLIHNDFTHAFTRMAYGILFTKPGNILFFQGEELASDINIQNEWDYIKAVNNIPTQNLDLNRYISDHKMLWEYLSPHSHQELYFLTNSEVNLFEGHHRFFKEMIDFRHNYPSIANEDVYNLRTTYDGSVISYQIKSDHNDFFILLNFGHDKSAAWISFPGNSSTWWKEIINSSIKEFGGSNSNFTNIIDQLGERSNLIRLKGPSITIFKKVDHPEINKQLYFMSDLNKWIADDDYRLLPKSDNINYQVKINIPKRGTYEFKLATHNWIIELGSANEYGYDNLNYGQLSYQPSRPNARVFLEKGRYSLTFNIRNFSYHFTKE